MSFNTFRKGALPFAVVSAFFITASFHAYGATQGETGPTSEGSVVIDLTIPPLIRITDLADIPLGTYDGLATEVTGGSPACVRTNNAEFYSIKATSANGLGGAFRLAGVATGTADGDFIPYSVSWTATQSATLSHDVVEAGFTADEQRLGSGACDTAVDKLTVTVAEADMKAETVRSGDYQDTLTLLVSPD